MRLSVGDSGWTRNNVLALGSINNLHKPAGKFTRHRRQCRRDVPSRNSKVDYKLRPADLCGHYAPVRS